ncbi:hypothetical protein GCM10023149_46070 [Mucilaginibacter gynuensis]|uniref:Uncharacterized protein n=1 Tax=Mucilaginibacter gynuensis TaxID=1302236 RepID=A0ABP8HBN7_9SPHI
MKSDIENKDWLNEFSALKQVNTNNPFTVPLGYFENLEDRILSLKNLDGFNINKTNQGFSVPENYFSDLSANIESRIVISNALSVENTSFTVPEGYFDELSSNIQSRVNIEEAMSESDGFEIPAGYFDNLHEQITARIAVEEILDAEPEETFAVPTGYFDKLNAAILAKTVNAEQEVAEVKEIAEAKPAQRKGIVRRLFNPGVYKYAAAACVTVAIGLSFFIGSTGNHTATDGHTHSYLHTQLSNIPVSDIKSYLESSVDAGETQAGIRNASNTLNNEEILDYIDTDL